MILTTQEEDTGTELYRLKKASWSRFNLEISWAIYGHGRDEL